MKIFTGRVVNGRVEVPADEFPDGTEVAVVPAESEETFTLTPQELAELQESMEQIRQGQFVDGDEFLEQLRSRRGS